jgi:hypothetical protein
MSKPGRIGLTQIHGQTGFGIRVGQWLNGSGFEDYEHAFMDLGDGTLIEAEPGGARISPLAKYQGSHSDVYWCDSIYATLTATQKQDVAYWGARFAGTPYSFLDYDALAMHRLHIWVPGLKDYIADSGHLICSQLCDLSYSRAGAHLFENRWPGYVAPGDLYLLDKRQSLELDLVTCGICGSKGYCHYCRPRRNYR